MRVINRLSRSQRLVVVVALGLALGVIGTYLMSLGSEMGFRLVCLLSADRDTPGSEHRAPGMAAPDHLAGADRRVGARLDQSVATGRR